MEDRTYRPAEPAACLLFVLSVCDALVNNGVEVKGLRCDGVFTAEGKPGLAHSTPLNNLTASELD